MTISRGRRAPLLFLLAAWPLAAQQSGVAATVHNLSVSGPGEIKAQRETEICKFCHVPHNGLEATPLWGHALSSVANYAVPEIQRDQGRRQPVPQPDGSSRLCLSCHDGTVALGDVARTGGIRMAGSQRLERGRRGYLGTDLSGSHPISIVMPESDSGRGDGSRDMGLRSPAEIRGEGVVKLDAQGKMQCTTCHDPHSDRYYQSDRVPRFWVQPTVGEVCLACHELH